MVAQARLNAINRYNDRRKKCLQNCLDMLGAHDIWKMEEILQNMKRKGLI